MVAQRRDLVGLEAAMTEARYQVSISAGVRRDRYEREVQYLSLALDEARLRAAVR